MLFDLLRLRGLAKDPAELPQSETSASDAARSRTALVVDDDAEMLATLREMLGVAGWDVTTAVDGVDALQKFTGACFDILLTDLAMPRLDGLSLARVCKTIRPEVPIVVFTAWATLVADEEFGDHGVDLVLSKPLRPSTLLPALDGVARRYRG